MSSIPIEDLIIYETTIAASAQNHDGIMPLLPLGILWRGQRLRTYSLTIDDIKQLPGDMVYDLQNHRGNFVEAISKFLARAIAAIGDIPVIEIATRMGITPQQLFKEMYVADICTMMFGLRRKYRGDELSVEQKLGDLPHNELEGTCFNIDYRLNDPFVIDGKTVALFRLEPPGFSLTIETLSQPSAFTLMMLSVIVGVENEDGEAVNLDERVFVEMSDRDTSKFEEIAAKLLNLGIKVDSPWLTNPYHFIFSGLS